VWPSDIEARPLYSRTRSNHGLITLLPSSRSRCHLRLLACPTSSHLRHGAYHGAYLQHRDPSHVRPPATLRFWISSARLRSSTFPSPSTEYRVYLSPFQGAPHSALIACLLLPYALCWPPSSQRCTRISSTLPPGLGKPCARCRHTCRLHYPLRLYRFVSSQKVNAITQGFTRLL
jgi:hypothetical protein